MNKNLVNYPIRFGTLLLAGASLAACSKTTFTETDAFRLEAQRARVTRQIDSLSRVQAMTDRVALLNWQNAVDQLEKANAGGKVFYTVIPVRGTDMVSGSGGPTQGGRTENAIANAVVTITQFGRVSTVGMTSMPSGSGGGPITTPTTPIANVNFAANGVFTFGDLRSGEVTVNITAANMTEVNYVANLTPDGGVPNNATIYVGNVVPMFELSTDATRMATVRGNVYYEGDLTNDREEPLTNEVFNGGAGTGTRSIVTAAIDMTRNDGSVNGLPYFHQRFLAESNGEGVNSFGVPVRSGAIQRIAYSATPPTGSTDILRSGLTAGTQAGGMNVSTYSMLVPSTAGGLPIQLRFAEFADYRTYYNERGQLIPKTVQTGSTGPRPERFLYGPTVVPTDVPVGVSRPQISIQAFTTPAVVSATFTAQVAGAWKSNFEVPGVNGVPGNHTAPNLRINNSGLYMTAPNVTLTAAAGSGATFTAIMSAYQPFNPPANTTSLAYLGAAQPTAQQLAASDWNHQGVVGLNIGNAGAGYAADDTFLPLTFTRTDIVSNIGFGGQFTPSGTTGSGLVPLNSFAQVIDGGAGFIFATPSTGLGEGITAGGTFTNYLPTPVFTETDQPTSADPTRGYTTPGVTITQAAARLFVDYNATYNLAGVPIAPIPPVPPATVGTPGTPAGVGVTSGLVGGTGGAPFGGVGAIQEVSITGTGFYPAGSMPFINFSFGETISTNGFLANAAPAVGGKNLFISGGPGLIKFNAGAGATNISTTEAERIFSVGAGNVNSFTSNSVTFAANQGWGSRYTFVPTIQITPNAATEAVIGAQTAANVRSMPVVATVSNNPNSPSFGKIVKIQLTSTPIAGLNSGADNNDFLGGAAPFAVGTTLIGINVIPSRYGNTLRVLGRVGGAQTQSTGTGINSYSYNNANTTLNTDVARIASASNGISSNTLDGVTIGVAAGVPIIGTLSGVLPGATVQQVGYLFGNEMLVAFSAPTAPSVNNAFAWGVPVLNNTGNGTGNTLLGARILNPGSGYAAPVSNAGNFTSNTTATLVPNPFFRGNRVTLSNGTASATISQPADIASANTPLGLTGTAQLLAGDIVGFLNAIANASAEIQRGRTPATPGFIDFTITAAGAGYATTPDVIVFGGGLDLTDFTGAFGTAPAANPVSPSVGGLIRLTGTGAVNSANAAIPNITAAGNRINSVGGLIRVGGAGPAGSGGRITFAANSAPAYNITATTPLNVRVIDRLSEDLTRQTNAVAGPTGVGATAIITPSATNPQSGVVSAVTFGRLTPNGAAGTDMITQVAYAGSYSQITQGNASATGGAFTPATLPVFFEMPQTGFVGATAATGTALIEVDNGNTSARHRRIYAIRVDNGGSGYGVGNRWQRQDTGTSVHRANQPFTVFGGFEGGGINGIYNSHLNQDNIRFDAFTGMTYTRDAHYGTGRLLD